MQNTFTVRRYIWIAGALAALLLAPRAQTEQPSGKLPVLTVERSGSRLVFKVDSQRVDPLRAFNTFATQHGLQNPVAVLVDSTIPIEEIWNIEAIASKAQLTSLRFFVVFRHHNAMSEIKRMPAVPLNTPIE